MSIPGFSGKTSDVFIAETGGDMSVFVSAGHLASWAGVSPGANESAGRVKSTKTRPGNPYLKGALGVSAMSAARSKDSFSPRNTSGSSPGAGRCVRSSPSNTLSSSPRGTCSPMARSSRLGTDYYSLRKPAKAKARAVSQLEALGYTVTLKPLADTA